MWEKTTWWIPHLYKVLSLEEVTPCWVKYPRKEETTHDLPHLTQVRAPTFSPLLWSEGFLKFQVGLSTVPFDNPAPAYICGSICPSPPHTILRATQVPCPSSGIWPHTDPRAVAWKCLTCLSPVLPQYLPDRAFGMTSPHLLLHFQFKSHFLMEDSRLPQALSITTSGLPKRTHTPTA